LSLVVVMLSAMDEQMDAVGFARVVDAVAAAARAGGLEVPSFRSLPPRGGPNRWVRWGPDGAVVGIVRSRRPATEVAADIVDAVVHVNSRCPVERRAVVRERLGQAASGALGAGLVDAA
jgi:hypothetical protein